MKPIPGLARIISICICFILLIGLSIPTSHVMAAPKSITLSEGDENKAVTLLQKQLKKQGYFDWEVTGFYGWMTANAVKTFQEKNALFPDGIAGPVTLKKLFGSRYNNFLNQAGIDTGGQQPPTPADSSTQKWKKARIDYPDALLPGDSNKQVEKMQIQLKKLGYYRYSTITGFYGPITLVAVQQFQSQNKLLDDGIVGPATLKKLYSKKAIKFSSSKTKTKHTIVVPKPNLSKVDKMINYALKFNGYRYVYGTAGPRTFDCSGLTSYVMKHMGVSLKRSAQDQGYDTRFKKLTRSQLRRGDLVFFNSNPKDGDLSDHVGIYLGGGQFIHAASTKTGVKISDMSSSYNTSHFSWGRRVLT